MGFFSLSADKAQVQQRNPSRPGCGACGLHKGCVTPRMGITGRGEKGIFILAESPSALEDRKGEQLIGEAGQLLRSELKFVGIDLDRDCWKMNAVNCRLPKEDQPSDAQIGWCRPMVWREIMDKKPAVIILLGGAAVKSFLMTRWKRGIGGITQWRGFTIPDREVGAWVCPTYHPVYVTRMEKEPVVRKIFRDDVRRAIDCLGQKLPAWKDEKEGVRILTDSRHVCEYLRTVLTLQPRYLAFDYETTGLKPHGPGQRLVCCSMSYNGHDAGAWMWENIEGEGLALFQKIMSHSAIGKVASNLKFEDNWTVAHAGVKPVNWAWDTMLAAHVMDNRSGISSIKFLTYIHLGRLPYDEHVSNLLEGVGKGGNALNRIDEIDPYDLMIYCGLDSIYEHQVAMLQMEGRV